MIEGGVPGWVVVATGAGILPQLLGYAEIQNSFSTSSSTPVAVNGLSCQVTTGLLPVKLTFSGFLETTGAANDLEFIGIQRDGTPLNGSGNTLPAVSPGGLGCTLIAFDSPPAGQHLYTAVVGMVTGTGPVAVIGEYVAPYGPFMSSLMVEEVNA